MSSSPPASKSCPRVYRAAEAGEEPSDSPVVAIQPPGKLDIRENFYLVPILHYEDIYLGAEQARLLEVSSVPLQSEKALPPPTAVQQAPAAATPIATNTAYRAGLVFAIDSTLSMDPYIERTREAVMKIYDALGDAGLLGNVNFGLVAFRDSPQAVPELEYLARTYVDLDQGRNPGTFLAQVNDLSAATISRVTDVVVEDALEHRPAPERPAVGERHRHPRRRQRHAGQCGGRLRGWHDRGSIGAGRIGHADGRCTGDGQPDEHCVSHRYAH